MAEPITQAGTRAPVQTALVCRLRHRVGRRGPSPTSGEVELENISEGVVEIEVSMHPLQYLDLIVTDAAGATVSARPYGDIFSPHERPYFLRLGRGEKYTHNVSLLGNVPPDKWLPGTYTVRAVYDYHGLRAVSEPLVVRLSAGDA